MERADIAIIGTGPAGVSAAITAKVRGKTVLLFGSRELSSKLTKAHKIQNYPGLPDIDGAQLAQAFKKHLDVLEIPITEKQGLHLMRATIHTELSPTVGSEEQGETLIQGLLKDFESDPSKLWSTNIFGKSLNELVNEGLQAKLMHMPAEARTRLQQTLERIINDGCDGLICILL